MYYINERFTYLLTYYTSGNREIQRDESTQESHTHSASEWDGIGELVLTDRTRAVIRLQLLPAWRWAVALHPDTVINHRRLLTTHNTPYIGRRTQHEEMHTEKPDIYKKVQYIRHKLSQA